MHIVNSYIVRIAVVFIVLTSGCKTSRKDTEPLFPSTVALTSGDTIRMGEPVGQGSSGHTVSFEGLHPSSGAKQLFVELDTLGLASSFEFWYGKDAVFEDVVGFYERSLGDPVERFERLTGECAIWRSEDYVFVLCKSKDRGEHGEVIAHVWRAGQTSASVPRIP